MANIVALSNLARSAAPVAQAAAGPSTVAAVSGTVATGATIAQAGAAAAGLTGAAGALAAAVPIIGLAAIAIPVAANLFSCGTVSQVGCTKRSDSTTINDIKLAAIQAAYAVETGSMSQAQALSILQQLNQTAPSRFGNVQRSWVSPAAYGPVPCGSFTNNGQAETGPPCSSRAAQVIPGGSSVNGPQIIQDYINFVQSQSPASTASSAASAVSGALGSVTSSTGIPGWVVVAAAAAGLFFLIK